MPEEIDQLQNIAESLSAYLIAHSPQLIGAVVIVILGLLIGNSSRKLILKICSKRQIDVTLSRFFGSTAKLAILLLFIVIAINKIGVETTPLIALLGASAFGLSLAVQGPISNYGSGIALIITRPFKVDNTLTIHGITGAVTVIKLGYTQLLTEDGQEITIPNRRILGEILTNSFELLVVEGVVGIDYASDPEQAIACVTQALSKTDGIDSKKTPQVGIQEFGDSSINIGYRYWVKTSNYYVIQYAANLEVFKSLKNAEIAIPFPQRDVRIVSNSERNTQSGIH